MEIRSLTARVQNAERRAINLQNQLAASEEKVTAINQKTTASDSKWEARVQEYEKRLKAAEEKVKRERQGGKERALELENQMKCVCAHCNLWQTVLNCFGFSGHINGRSSSRRSVSKPSTRSSRPPACRPKAHPSLARALLQGSDSHSAGRSISSDFCSSLSICFRFLVSRLLVVSVIFCVL